MTKIEKPALIIIDVQLAIDCFSDHPRGNLEAEDNIALLLQTWRKYKLPIFHVQHSSKHLDSPYHASKSTYAFKAEVAPKNGEFIICKRENSAFINTDLSKQLEAMDIRQLVVCGVLINNSVDATIRVAAGLGYQVTLPEDATAAFGMTLLDGRYIPPEDVHMIFTSNLAGEYCRVVNTTHLLLELAKTQSQSHQSR